VVKEIHHLGIAVADLDAAIAVHERIGSRVVRRGEFNGLDYALLDCGGTELELLHSDDLETAIGKFLAERGPGLHHLAFAVTDLPAELDRLLGEGMQQSGEIRVGIHGTPIVFIHPKSVAGVLTELVEVRDGGHGS